MISKQVSGDSIVQAGNINAVNAAAGVIESLTELGWGQLSESQQNQLLAAQPDMAAAIARLRTALENL